MGRHLVCDVHDDDQELARLLDADGAVLVRQPREHGLRDAAVALSAPEHVARLHADDALVDAPRAEAAAERSAVV